MVIYEDVLIRKVQTGISMTLCACDCARVCHCVGVCVRVYRCICVDLRVTSVRVLL